MIDWSVSRSVRVPDPSGASPDGAPVRLGRVSADRPINADVRAPEGAPEPPEPKNPGEKTVEPSRGGPSRTARTEPPQPPPRRRAAADPGPIKLVAILVVIAIGVIVLAVLAGSGAKKGDGGAAPRPRPRPRPPPRSNRRGRDLVLRRREGDPNLENLRRRRRRTRLSQLRDQQHDPDRRPRPDRQRRRHGARRLPLDQRKAAPGGVALVGEGRLGRSDRRRRADGRTDPRPAPLRRSRRRPRRDRGRARRLQPQGGAASGGDAVLAVGNVEVPNGMNAAKLAAGDAASEAAAIARLRDRLAGGKPDAIVLASSSEPAFAAPAAAYAARSGDPVLFTEAEALPPADGRPAAPRRRRAGLRPRPRLGDLRQGPEGSRSARRQGAADQRRQPGPERDLLRPLRRRQVRLAHLRPRPRLRHGPLRRAARSRRRGGALGLRHLGPLLVTDSADTLPSELRGYFLDVKPGYTNDPTRAFYNHVWIVGDTGQISVQQQAEVNEVAELAKIGTEE